MSEISIKRTTENNEKIDGFLNEGFTRYGEKNGVALNYDDFCFVAEDESGKIAGGGNHGPRTTRRMSGRGAS